MISVTLLTQNDCAWCTEGKVLLDELARDFPLQVDEIDLHSDIGCQLATEHRVMFAPGLIANGRLVAHGRLSKRALRREFLRIDSTAS